MTAFRNFKLFFAKNRKNYPWGRLQTRFYVLYFCHHYIKFGGNTMKRALAVILTIAMAFTMASCSIEKLLGGVLEVGDQDPGLKSAEELAETLTNYKMVFEYTTTSESKEKETQTWTEMRCDQGYMSAPGDSTQIIFVEYGTGQYYLLDSETKTGEVITLSSTEEDIYKTFGAGLSVLLFNSVFTGVNTFKKAGTEKIAGRNTTVYTLKLLVEYKLWVDEQLGMAMKSSWSVPGEGSVTTEIKELKVGGVKLSDMVKLTDYEIRDLNEEYP